MSAARVLPLAALLAGVAIGCTDRDLVPVDDDRVQVFDDRIQIEADFCERESNQVVFPVKVLLVLDGSGSLQFTDQTHQRKIAAENLVNDLALQDNIFLSMMIFGSNIYVTPDVAPGAPAYVRASEFVIPDILGVADVQTNYHGALAAVRNHILFDMLNSDPAELARTKYVTIFFSDGAPSPICCIAAEETTFADRADPFACAPEPWEAGLAGSASPFCDGNEEQAICNDDETLDRFRDAQTPVAGAGTPPDYGAGVLAALNEIEVGSNYNRIFQIEDQVSDIVEMTEEFGVGEFRMHTALLFDSTLPDLVKEIYRLNRCRSENLLRRMSELGNGVFRDFENAEEIDFLSFNFTSLQQQYSLFSTMALNQHAVPTETGFTADSDADGLADTLEFERGYDPVVADSDKLVNPPLVTEVPTLLDQANWGDGYSDQVEHALADVGYDARYQSLPSVGCPFIDPGPRRSDRLETDYDGLNGCEENLFGTDIEVPDTDGDGITDGLEIRFGTDPLVPESGRDDDFDGAPNFDEIRQGTDPQVPDQERDGDLIRYELLETGVTPDGRQCYRQVVNNVRVVTTEPRFDGGRRGYNDIYFWIADLPDGSTVGNTELRFACERVQYIEPSFKEPAQGEIFFTEEDLWDLSNPEHIGRLIAGEDPCKGLPIE
jgi:hypothetical protein